jgi:PAS domain S-box-containing protein
MDSDGAGDDADNSQRHLAALQDLTAAMADSDGSVEDRIGRVLDVGCEHLGYPSGFLAIVTGDWYEVTAAAGEGADDAVGDASPVGETYCRHTLERDDLFAIPDVSETAPEDPAYDRWGLETYVGIPIEVEGETYGTLCFGDQSEARRDLDPWQETLLSNLRQWVEGELERERLTARRDRNERLFEATFNSPNIFVGILDADGTTIRANETALSFAGIDESDVRGRPFCETPWWSHDDEQQSQCREAIERAGQGEVVEFEAVHVGVDGDRIRTAVTVRPVYEDGEVSEIVAEGLDITELKDREEKMEFFNGILRHDILNGMNVVRARAERLDAQLEGEQGEHARTILKWSDDIVDLTSKVRSVLSTLGADGLSDPEPIALREALESAATRPRGADGDCTVRMEVPDVTVAADELLDDVFANVMLNAVEHAETSPEIDVTATTETEMVAVRIADDGPGISPERRQEVFERGAKRNGSGGTGFGLYFVDAMVDSYGGDAWIEESDSGGATVVITLPRAA